MPSSTAVPHESILGSVIHTASISTEPSRAGHRCFALFDLPPEIRTIVFDTAIGRHSGRACRYDIDPFAVSRESRYSRSGRERTTLWALVRTCRQIHDEMLPLLYEGVKFCFDFNVDSSLPVHASPNISGVRLDLVSSLKIAVAADAVHTEAVQAILERSLWGANMANLEFSVTCLKRQNEVEDPGLVGEIRKIVGLWSRLVCRGRIHFDMCEDCLAVPHAQALAEEHQMLLWAEEQRLGDMKDHRAT